MVNRRDFLIDSARMLAGTSFLGRSFTLPAQPQLAAEYTIRIAKIRLEIAPGKIVRTTAFNGRVPGDLIRIREGQNVTIDVINETDASDIVHWHGLHIPSLQDGAAEEGSPESAPRGGMQRYTWIAKPAGCRWYHSHMSAGHNLSRSTYSGEFGFLMIDPASNPARYDQEIFLALHDWEGHAQGGAEGYQEVIYSHATINDRMLGFGESHPREGRPARAAAHPECERDSHARSCAPRPSLSRHRTGWQSCTYAVSRRNYSSRRRRARLTPSWK